MIYTGKLFEHSPNEIADVTVVEGEKYLWVQIEANGQLVIKFPLGKDADRSRIISITQNIVNTTGLVSNPAKVEIESVV